MQGSLAPRPQRHGAAIESYLFGSLDLIGETQFDVGLHDRRRQQDAPVRRGARQFGHRDKGRTRQRQSLIDRRTAPVGEHEATIAAIARDAVWKRQRQHHAGGWYLPSPTLPRKGGGRRKRHLRCPALCQAARLACGLRAVAAKLAEPYVEDG